MRQSHGYNTVCSCAVLHSRRRLAWPEALPHTLLATHTACQCRLELRGSGASLIYWTALLCICRGLKHLRLDIRDLSRSSADLLRSQLWCARRPGLTHPVGVPFAPNCRPGLPPPLLLGPSTHTTHHALQPVPAPPCLAAAARCRPSWRCSSCASAATATCRSCCRQWGARCSRLQPC